MEGLAMEEGGRVFLGIFDGLFEHKYKTPQPGCKQRINKNGKTIYYTPYNSLTGTLRGLTMKEAELVPGVKTMFWAVTMQTADGKFLQIDLQESSSSTFYFLSRLVCADVTKPMKLKVFAEVKDDKKKTILLIYQGSDKPIAGLWTKDHPGDCPDMVKTMFRGKEVWDDTDRNAYVREYVYNTVASKIVAPVEAAESAPDGPQDDPDEGAGAEVPDWLTKAQTAPQQAPPPTAKDEKGFKAAPVQAPAPRKNPAQAPAPKENPFLKK